MEEEDGMVEKKGLKRKKWKKIKSLNNKDGRGGEWRGRKRRTGKEG